MSFYNIFFSPTGGTKKVATALMSSLCDNYRSIDLIRDIEPIYFEKDDVCLISVPSFGGRVPQIAINRIKKLSANGAKAVLNCVYGNREWEDTLTELQDTLEEIGFICVAAVAAVAEHSIFRQFAAGRPDSADVAELKKFGVAIEQKLNSGCYEPLVLNGNHNTYKQFGGSSFKPEAADSCVGCAICANECPVGAISISHIAVTNKELCISCMRCIAFCPNNSRDFDPGFMAETGAKMESRLGGHKQNHLFV